MKRTFLLLLAVICITSAQAQMIFDYLRGADEYFNKGDYYSAANYYEKYLGMTFKGKTVGVPVAPYAPQKGKTRRTNKELSSKDQALYNLAECYRLLHYYEKAEPAYKDALALDRASFPLTRYWYANTLRSLGKYPEAQASYKQFIAEYGTADQYKTTAEREIKNLDFIQQQMARKDLNLYRVNKAGGDVPDSGAVYAPLWYNNNVYFTSTKADLDAPKLQAHNNRVYQANYDTGSLSGVAKITLPETKEYQQGVVSFAPDGNIMYVTRWSHKNGKKVAQLCRSIKMNDGSWSNPDPIVSGINVDGYSSQQPFVMPGGKFLLFSSDQPGGAGGFDLWMAPIDVNGREGAPVNMGNVLNTAGDDQAPYFHEASSTLVYSSNGMVGMGGFDFFYSKGQIGNWKAPVNYGYPVNSAKDDIYFASRGGARNILDDVLLSSDRNDVCCLNLFSLHKDRLPRTIKGTVVSCEDKAPMAGATIKIVDLADNSNIKDLVTDSKGNYSFTIEDYKPLKAVAAYKGYYTDSTSSSGPVDFEEMEFTNPSICLNPFPKENPFRMNNVLFDFDKYDLRPESYTDLERLVAMMNSDTSVKIEIQAHTDYKGTDEYNMKLSEKRAITVMEYVISKGIRSDRVGYQAFGRSMPIAPNTNPDGSDNPEGRQLNRRIEVKVLNK